MRRLKRPLGLISSHRIVNAFGLLSTQWAPLLFGFPSKLSFSLSFFFQFGLHIAISTSLAVKILEPFSVVVGGEITHPQLMVLTMVSNVRCVCERSLYVSLCFRLLSPFFFQI